MQHGASDLNDIVPIRWMPKKALHLTGRHHAGAPCNRGGARTRYASQATHIDGAHTRRMLVVFPG
jgi:hypothetical protein